MKQNEGIKTQIIPLIALGEKSVDERILLK
jgi:hypothetical protein